MDVAINAVIRFWTLPEFSHDPRCQRRRVRPQFNIDQRVSLRVGHGVDVSHEVEHVL
jgi:hypothetical protein